MENNMENKYTLEQVQEAIEALTEAHEVMKDPALMKVVQDKLKGISKIKSIGDLKTAASESQKLVMSSAEMENEGMDPKANYGDPEENTAKGKTTLSSEDDKD